MESASSAKGQLSEIVFKSKLNVFVPKCRDLLEESALLAEDIGCLLSWVRLFESLNDALKSILSEHANSPIENEETLCEQAEALLLGSPVSQDASSPPPPSSRFSGLRIKLQKTFVGSQKRKRGRPFRNPLLNNSYSCLFAASQKRKRGRPFSINRGDNSTSQNESKQSSADLEATIASGVSANSVSILAPLKRKRGRPFAIKRDDATSSRNEESKEQPSADLETSIANIVSPNSESILVPTKRKRGRPFAWERDVSISRDESMKSCADLETTIGNGVSPNSESILLPPKRKRGRPVSKNRPSNISSFSSAAEVTLVPPVEKRKRGRPFKIRPSSISLPFGSILGAPKRKRGRPFKFKREGSDSKDVDGLSLQKVQRRRRRQNGALQAYECKQCGCVFNLQRWYNLHLANHNREREAMSDGAWCAVCGLHSASRRGLAVHFNVAHPQPKSEIETAEFFQCAICSATLKSSQRLKIHLRSIHPTEEQTFVCEICGFKTRLAANLSVHRHTVHAENIGQFKCHSCSAAFKSRSYLANHVRVLHRKVLNYKCDQCPMAFASECSRRRHYASHTGEKAYSCAVCSKAFRRPAHVVSHVRGVHKMQFDPSLCQMNSQNARISKFGNPKKNYVVVDAPLTSSTETVLPPNVSSSSSKPKLQRFPRPKVPREFSADAIEPSRASASQILPNASSGGSGAPMLPGRMPANEYLPSSSVTTAGVPPSRDPANQYFATPANQNAAFGHVTMTEQETPAIDGGANLAMNDFLSFFVPPAYGASANDYQYMPQILQ